MPNYSVTEFPLLFEGDVVTYDRGSTLYKITHLKRVKALAIESVTGRKVELRLEHCKKADKSAFVETEENLKPAPILALGMAVRFKRHPERGVYVVINQTAGGWKVAKLGGREAMRYYYNLDPKDLVPVDEINSVDWK